jgi:Domain of unknown function (DUF4145)
MPEQIYRQNIKCPHCRNTVTMPIVASYSQVQEHGANGRSFVWSEGNVFQILKCPACDGVTFQRGYFNDQFPEEWQPAILYATEAKKVDGLPPEIERAYTAALVVKSIEAHAFAVLVRRLLEMICQDKRAQGRNLFEQLKSLAQTGVIPQQLIDIASGLRTFGNIGAHAAGAQLSENEVPVIDALCRAILEYVYGAPHLVRLAQETLDKVKGTRGNN